MFKSTLWSFISAIVLSVSISGLVTALFVLKTVEPIQRKLTLSSPIAVVDFGRAVLSLGPNATEQAIESRLQEINHQIAKLASAGFIVLDAQAVVRASDTVFVPIQSKASDDVSQ